MAMNFPRPGSVLADRFEVRAPIGAGNFGVVFSGFDREAGEDVAIKTLKRAAFDMPDLVERFHREAAICSALHHPNIVSLRHFGQVSPPDGSNPLPYMVLDMVPGLPVGPLLAARGALTIREASAVVAQVLDGLHAAHLLGIVHRDLKPNNILITAPDAARTSPASGPRVSDRLGVPPAADPTWADLETLRARVVDFGLGKMLEVGGRRVKRLTQAGVAAGTAHFMSPEQIQRPQRIDHRADIYGAAMLFFRVLTGHHAFQGDTIFDVATQQLTAPPPPLPAPYTGHAVEQVFQRAAAKAPEDRYESAARMAWELRHAAAPQTTAQAPPDDRVPDLPGRRNFFSRIFGR